MCSAYVWRISWSRATMVNTIALLTTPRESMPTLANLDSVEREEVESLIKIGGLA